MEELKNLLNNFNGEVYNLCYEILVSSDNQVEAFEYVCKNLLKYPKNGTIQIKEYFSEIEFQEYESIYGDTVKGLLNTNIKKCNLGLIAVQDFYKTLWESYCSIFQTDKDRAFAFCYTVCSKAIPFQYLGKPLSMSNELFRTLIEKNKESIDKIKYIARSGYSQKTERASLLLNCINEIEDFDSKVVVLSQALLILGQNAKGLFSDSTDIDSLIQSIDKKIEELEAEEAAEAKQEE